MLMFLSILNFQLLDILLQTLNVFQLLKQEWEFCSAFRADIYKYVELYGRISVTFL